MPSVKGNASAHHITLDGIRASYISHFMGTWGNPHGQWTQSSGIMLVGEDHLMTRCLVAYSAGNGVSLYGYRHRIVDNVIHDVNYTGVHASGIFFNEAPGNTPGERIVPTDIEIGHNTLYRAGWGLIDGSNLYGSSNTQTSRVHHNYIDSPALQTKDVGGIRFVGHTKEPFLPRNTRVDHNVVRNCVAALGNPIYFDFNNDYVVDHNIVYDSNQGININEAGNLLVLNNTILSYAGGIGGVITGHKKQPHLAGVICRNNIVNHNITDEGKGKVDASYTADHNIENTDTTDMFVDPAHGDFRLKEGSKAIDAGQPMPPYTDGFKGEAPDLGALEFGGEDWTKTVGASWQVVKAPSRLAGKLSEGGTVTFTWEDNADNEKGYVIEVGYETGHPNGGWEYVVLARTNADATSWTGKVDRPWGAYFYRVRAERSHYSNVITLLSGRATPGTITFDVDQGYKVGPLSDHESWVSVSGQSGLQPNATEKGFVVVGDGEDKHVEVVGGGRIVATGGLDSQSDAFDPHKSRVRFSLDVGLKAMREADDKAEAAKIEVGGMNFWRSPGGAVATFVIAPDGAVKWAWKKFGQLDAPGEMVTLAGVFDLSAGEVTDLMLDGEPVEGKFTFKAKDTTFGHGLWQINGGEAGADNAVLLDNLTLEVLPPGQAGGGDATEQ
jgi:hypothetical protein